MIWLERTLLSFKNTYSEDKASFSLLGREKNWYSDSVPVWKERGLADAAISVFSWSPFFLLT